MGEKNDLLGSKESTKGQPFPEATETKEDSLEKNLLCCGAEVTSYSY